MDKLSQNHQKYMKIKNVILGSGVGGLGAGCWLKEYKEKFIIIDRLNEIPMNLHNGVHYLHSIPELPFDAKLKEITLTDGVLTEEGRIRHQPELQDALMYSEKVRSIQHPSSIYEVGTRKSVFVPKSNSMNDYISQMVEFIGEKNFMLGADVISIDLDRKEIIVKDKEKEQLIEFENLVSTIPLNVFLKLTKDKEFNALEFLSTPINITNFKVERIVPNWLINIYIPDPKQKVYRLSILNNIASIESISKLEQIDYGLVKELFRMFHISLDSPHEYSWDSGKIVSLDIDTRDKIFNHFTPMGIFLIGRFGCWNNKLLIDATINQAKEVCKYINMEKVNKVDTENLISALL